jgi:hypothetical protein
LGENEIKIIELMKDNKYITAKELSEHIKISTTLAFPPPSRGDSSNIPSPLEGIFFLYLFPFKGRLFRYSLPFEGGGLRWG